MGTSILHLDISVTYISIYLSLYIYICITVLGRGKGATIQNPGGGCSFCRGQFIYFNSARRQAWGQSTRYFGTLVLEYRFFRTRRYSVLLLLKSTCTRTCTQVLLEMKVFLTSTYEY